MTTTEITKEHVLRVFENPAIAKRAVERALVLLYNRQTTDEKHSRHTHYENDRGFNHADAKRGTLHAERCIRYGRITNEQYVYWMKIGRGGNRRIGKYWRQLIEEAEKKKGA